MEQETTLSMGIASGSSKVEKMVFVIIFLLFSVIIQSDIYRILHIFQLPTTVTALS